MNCLCCGKPIKNSAEGDWHVSCIKKFFGTKKIPKIDIDETSLKLLASELTGKGFTVPGVQKKLSLHLHSEADDPRLTLVNYPTGYILKPQVDDFECLPESEQLVMTMADITGIKTVPHALIKSGNSYAYITKRVDRIIDNNIIKKLAMEDFCQLDHRLTIDKYKGSYERCSKIISRYSSQIGIDMSELFMRIVFSYVVGNSDMHLKNFSLLESETDKGTYTFSPAYDLLPVKIIMPEDHEELALALNGKKSNIRKNDFLEFAEFCKMPKSSANKIIDKIVSMKDQYINKCNESMLPAAMKKLFAEYIENKCMILK